MAKRNLGAAAAVSPITAFLITCADKNGNSNILTISMSSARHSHPTPKETGEFVINIPGENLAKATDQCGLPSGRSVSKRKAAGRTPAPASIVKVPLIKECPVNIECVVQQSMPQGSHDIFLAKTTATHADEDCLDDKAG